MTTTTLNLRHLRAFEAVGHTGRVSPVADAVHMSQPAISQALAKLETRCGTALFDREPSGLRLTQAGVLMHERVQRALAMIDNGAEAACGRRGDAPRVSRLMTSTQLRALIAIADNRGLSAAARVIKTSQPAISRATRDLEALCDNTLIEVSGRGVMLTKPAQALVHAARLAFSELRSGLEEVQALSDVDTSMLIIGSLPLARSAILPKAVVAFTETKPDVAVHIIDGPYDDMLDGLRRGEIDLMIGALRSPPPFNDVVETILFDDSLSLITRAKHPLATKRSITAGQLGGYPWIIPRTGTPTREHFDELASLHWRGNAPRHIEASSLIFIRGLLLESDAVAIMSKQQVFFECSIGTLSVLDYELLGSKRSIGITHRQNWQPTRTQKLFLQSLRNAIASMNLVSFKTTLDGE